MKRMSKAVCLILSLSLLLGIFTATALAAYENTYKNTGSGADDIVSVAKTQMGYAESDSGYTKYGEFVGNSTMDWCAAFICWCASQAGIGTSVIPRNASSSGMYSFFKNKKLTSLSQYQGSSYIPKKGDIVFISNYDYSESGINHVGLVTSVSGKTVYVTEGNYNAWDGNNNKVTATSYAVNAKKLIAFATPNYDGESTIDNVTGDIYLMNEAVRFRSGAGLSFSVVTSSLIPAGTYLTVTEINDSDIDYIWGKTTYNGVTGWACLNWSTLIKSQSSNTKEVDWLVVDLAQWQVNSKINWDAFKNEGIKGVILRVGGRYYGSTKALYEDSEFAAHYSSAKKAGLYVGAYFFSYALTAAQAREEAEYTINILQKNNCVLDMPVFIDIEDSDGGLYLHYNAGKTVCTTVVNEFCSTIEKAGYYPGIYCSKAFAEDLISPGAFTDKAVWIAHYGVAECGYSGSYDMWQKTDDYKSSAYFEKLDLNHCYTDFPSLIAAMAMPVSFGEHTPGEWKITKQASCTQSGTRTIVCTDKNCGITLVSDTIQPTAHTESASFCINNEYITAGTVLSSAQLSALKTASEQNIANCKEAGGTSLTYCKNCKKVISADCYYTSCEHSSITTKTTASTCTTQGTASKVCNQCKKTLSSELLVLSSHKTGELTLKGVSCTVSGTEQTECAVCKKIIRTSFSPAYGHTAGTWTTNTKVTCINDGKLTAKCTICGAALTETIEKASYCDIDASSVIDSADARIVLRAAVGLETLSVREKAAADADNNSSIEAADARIILRIAVSLENAAAQRKLYYGA